MVKVQKSIEINGLDIVTATDIINCIFVQLIFFDCTSMSSSEISVIISNISVYSLLTIVYARSNGQAVTPQNSDISS